MIGLRDPVFRLMSIRSHYTRSTNRYIQTCNPKPLFLGSTIYSMLQESDSNFIFNNSIANEPILMIYGIQSPEKMTSNFFTTSITPVKRNHCTLRNTRK